MLEITNNKQIDSAIIRRFLIPAICYISNTHHRDITDGSIEFYHGVKIMFWSWQIVIKFYHVKS